MTESHFTTLPLLVTDGICEHLALADILSLRLVSRTFTPPPHVMRTCFEHRSTDLTEQSLLTLGMIAAHPYFGGLVRSLTVVAQAYDDRIIRDNLRSQESWESNQVYDQRIEMWSPRAKDIQNLQTEQSYMTNSGRDVELLAAALTNLPSLKTVDIDVNIAKLTGSQRFADSSPSSPRYRNVVWPQTHHAFSVLLAALAQSGSQPKTLHPLRSMRGGIHVDLCHFHQVASTLQNEHARHSLSRLRDLSLGLANPGSCPSATPCSALDPASCDVNCAIGTKALLSGCAETLETLVLSWYLVQPRPTHGILSFFTAFSTLNFSALRECTIRGLAIETDAFLDFLARVPKLQRLSLSHLTLFPIAEASEAWRPVFEGLVGPTRRAVGLQKLEMSYLRSSGDIFFGPSTLSVGLDGDSIHTRPGTGLEGSLSWSSVWSIYQDS
ncbi:unnamed protein product [Parascedosporium putredinis]|uniref:F-box domain-containing protein n=1 Tax=Parascedosporium putredinis TaxID=1442378 RepID=A0A9P1HAC7_9PEZI|nr:unnamed protein product [Parascedosporium putredinis]CAI8001734.1 unnamed protein product [Parascedosporium putredinis]